VIGPYFRPRSRTIGTLFLDPQDNFPDGLTMSICMSISTPWRAVFQGSL